MDGKLRHLRLGAVGNNKPRLCFVGPMLGRNPGWVPNPMEILAPYLEARGYVCVLTSRTVNRYLRLAEIVQTLLLRRNDYDLVSLQTYGGPSSVVEEIVGVVAQVLRKPLIMVLHGGAMPQYVKRRPGWSTRILGRANLIVTPSSYLAEAIEPYGFSATIVPNIIPLESYPFKERRKVRPRLLWMRTFHDLYNPQMAVHVLREVLQELPDAELTLAGQEKGIGAEVRALASSLGLSERVHFPGFLDMEGKRHLFAQHDIFLNTTFIDNMPVCLIEAGAFGLPIVSTNVGGVSHMVKHKESAMLVEPDDVEGMASAVRELVTEPRLAAKLSANGRRLAKECSPEVVVPLWEVLLQNVWSNGHSVRSLSGQTAPPSDSFFEINKNYVRHMRHSR